MASTQGLCIKCGQPVGEWPDQPCTVRKTCVKCDKRRGRKGPKQRVAYGRDLPSGSDLTAQTQRFLHYSGYDDYLTAWFATYDSYRVQLLMRAWFGEEGLDYGLA